MSFKMKTQFRNIKAKNILIILLGSAVVAFGMYNVHDVSDITEGGIFGLDLLLEYHFGISPAYTNLIFTALCFFLGWRALGRDFIVCSAFSTLSFSLFYAIMERTPRIFPQIADYPLPAALAGALFVGVGVGLSVREGGAQSGDDALAMALHHYFGWSMSAVYLVSDLVVLALSLTYIPVRKIIFSLITVVLSGQLIGLISKVGKK